MLWGHRGILAWVVWEELKDEGVGKGENRETDTDPHLVATAQSCRPTEAGTHSQPHLALRDERDT